MPTLYYDFIDPLSYLVVCELDEVAGEGRRAEDLVAWRPFELRPPPTPLVTADDEGLTSRWSEARRLGGERGVTFAPPRYCCNISACCLSTDPSRWATKTFRSANCCSNLAD